MVASGEQHLRTFVVRAKFGDGFFVALVPAALSLEQVEAAFHELGIEAEQLFELTDWRTSSENVAVARVPAPEGR